MQALFFVVLGIVGQTADTAVAYDRNENLRGLGPFMVLVEKVSADVPYVSAERIKTSVENCSLELTLVDIGGIPSKENEQICSGATHIVILAGDPSRIPEWHEFAEKLGLIVVAEIFSDYHGAEDNVEGVAQNGVLHGSVHYLERGENVSERPMIRTLAEHLINL